MINRENCDLQNPTFGRGIKNMYRNYDIFEISKITSFNPCKRCKIRNECKSTIPKNHKKITFMDKSGLSIEGKTINRSVGIRPIMINGKKTFEKVQYRRLRDVPQVNR